MNLYLQYFSIRILNFFILVAFAFLFSCNQTIEKSLVQKRTQFVTKKLDTPNYKIDKGNLDKKQRTIELTYGYISCTCAQWALMNGKFSNNGVEYIYIEPADSNVITEEEILGDINVRKVVKLTGAFYENWGYPKDYNPGKGKPNSARVFRYSKASVRLMR